MIERTLADYKALIEGFLNGVISVEDFEARYLRTFKDDSTIRDDNEYEILNRLFSDVDVFRSDANPSSCGELNEDGLRDAASSALAALSRVSAP